MADQAKWRLVFKKNSQFFKLSTFWGWDKDATLNFHIYSKDKVLRKVKQVSETKTDNLDGTSTVTQKIAFEDVIPVKATISFSRGQERIVGKRSHLWHFWKNSRTVRSISSKQL